MVDAVLHRRVHVVLGGRPQQVPQLCGTLWLSIVLRCHASSYANKADTLPQDCTRMPVAAAACCSALAIAVLCGASKGLT